MELLGRLRQREQLLEAARREPARVRDAAQQRLAVRGVRRERQRDARNCFLEQPSVGRVVVEREAQEASGCGAERGAVLAPERCVLLAEAPDQDPDGVDGVGQQPRHA